MKSTPLLRQYLWNCDDRRASGMMTSAQERHFLLDFQTPGSRQARRFPFWPTRATAPSALGLNPRPALEEQSDHHQNRRRHDRGAQPETRPVVHVLAIHLGGEPVEGDTREQG